MYTLCLYLTSLCAVLFTILLICDTEIDQSMVRWGMNCALSVLIFRVNKVRGGIVLCLFLYLGSIRCVRELCFVCSYIKGQYGAWGKYFLFVLIFRVNMVRGGIVLCLI